MAAPAAAQTAAPETAPAAGQHSGTQLEEVVVTAQRREESQQTVPVSVTALSGKALEALGVKDSAELSNFVPGLNITRANIAAVPFLRGVGNFTATPGNEAANALYIDDVYYASPVGSTFSYNNIARVEVLKGPQGTLFGRNAAGGVINVITRDPSHTPLADMSVGYGNYNTVYGSFYGSTGFGDKIAGDLSVNYQKQYDGWGKNLYDGRDEYLNNDLSLRTKWVFTPTDSTRIRFIADYDKTRNDMASASNLLPGSISLGGLTHFGGFYDVDLNKYAYGRNTQYGTSLRIDQDLGWANFVSISSIRRSTGHTMVENDSSPLDIQESQIWPMNFTKTQEFQLAAPSSSKIKWIVGLYGFFDRAGEDPIIQYGTAQASHPDRQQIIYSVQKTTSYAAFGQATAPVFNDDTHLTLGLRYTDDQRSVFGAFYESTGRLFNTVYQEDSWPKLTYKVALDHQFTDDLFGYVSYSRGFKSGNFNTLSPTAAPVRPEVIDAGEVGFKSEFLDHSLRLNASAFYYHFTDIQVQEALITGTIQLNAASAVYKGVDVDVLYAPTEHLTLQASAEALDPKYTNFPAAVFNYPCTSNTLPGCAASVGGGGYYTGPGNAAGNTIPYAEKFTATVSANYHVPLQTGALNFVGSVAYHGGFPFDVQNLLPQPAYTLVNGSVRWSSPGDIWGVKIWGENLGNVKYFGQKQVSGVGETYTPNRPRMFGITLDYHWE